MSLVHSLHCSSAGLAEAVAQDIAGRANLFASGNLSRPLRGNHCYRNRGNGR